MDKILEYFGYKRTIINQEVDLEMENLLVEDYNFDEKYGATNKDLSYFHIFGPDDEEEHYFDTKCMLIDGVRLDYSDDMEKNLELNSKDGNIILSRIAVMFKDKVEDSPKIANNKNNSDKKEKKIMGEVVSL